MLKCSSPAWYHFIHEIYKDFCIFFSNLSQAYCKSLASFVVSLSKPSCSTMWLSFASLDGTEASSTLVRRSTSWFIVIFTSCSSRTLDCCWCIFSLNNLLFGMDFELRIVLCKSKIFSSSCSNWDTQLTISHAWLLINLCALLNWSWLSL